MTDISFSEIPLDTYVARFSEEHLSSLIVGQEVDLTMNGKTLCKLSILKIEGDNVYFNLPSTTVDWNKVLGSPATVLSVGCEAKN